jgi:acyl-CoA thioester hydrolase
MFKGKKDIQIRMTDLDPFGHVNNGVIYSYYDIGRLHYLNQIGEDTQWENIDKVVVHTECDFMESILFSDDICVETKITEIGHKSIKMMQRIVDNNTGKIKSICLSVLSGYDRENNTSKEISDAFKEKVKLFEEV